MIAILIIFYGSLFLIATLVTTKLLEQTGNIKILAQFNSAAEPVIKKFTAGAKNNLTEHLNVRRVGWFAIISLKTIEKILLSAQIKIRRWSEVLTQKVRYHNLNKNKGAASFFLKDITDYKNHLPKKETLDF